MTCPRCQSPAFKVMYSGIPMKLCGNEDCSCCWGLWSGVMTWIPFNGMFIRYGDGVSYGTALWRFLRGDFA